MYRLVLHGSKDASPTGLAALKIRLAQKLGMPGRAIDGMFSDLPFTLKDNLTENQAQTLKRIIDELGSVTEIEKASDLDLTLSPAEDNHEEQEMWHQSAIDSTEHEVDFDLTLSPDSDRPSLVEETTEDLDELTGELESLIGDLTGEDEVTLVENKETEELVFATEEEEVELEEIAKEETTLDTGGLSFSEPEASEPEAPSTKKPDASSQPEVESELNFTEEETPEEPQTNDSEVEETGYVNLTPEEEQEMLSKAFSKKETKDAPQPETIDEEVAPEVSEKKQFNPVLAVPVIAVMAGAALLIFSGEEESAPSVTPIIQLERLDRILGPVKNKPISKKNIEIKTISISGEDNGISYEAELVETKDGVLTAVKLKISGTESPELTKEQIIKKEERTPWLVKLEAEGKVKTEESGGYSLLGKAWLTDGDSRGRVIPKVFIERDSGISVTAHYMPNKELPFENFFGKGSNDLYEFFLTFNADTKTQD